MWMIENHIKKIMTSPPLKSEHVKYTLIFFKRVRIAKVDVCTPLQISYFV